MYKMFEIKNVRTAVNAEKCELFTFGYFANDIASLRQTVENGKLSLRTVYDRLDGIHEERFERRFSCLCGSFSLFYPTDRIENDMRY